PLTLFSSLLTSPLTLATATLSLTTLFRSRFGLAGTGIAFFGQYVFYWFLIYAVVRQRSDFRWSVANKRTGALFVLMLAGVFVGRSEEHTSELQSRVDLVCRLLLEKKNRE